MRSIYPCNQAKIAAGGAAFKVNTSEDIREVFYKRDEEDEIWQHIKEGETNGSTIILYGQKRCGKTSLYVIQLMFPIIRNFLLASIIQIKNSLNKLNGGLVITMFGLSQ